MKTFFNRFVNAVKMYYREGGYESFSFYWVVARKPLSGSKRKDLEKKCTALMDDWLSDY
tara:strand:- start:4832 stop:5008 length:177 start_codon:yes stop_codon:yes gene_type:complete